MEGLGWPPPGGPSAPPLMAGPTSNADTANITANTANPIAGAHQVPKRRRSRSRNGTDAPRPRIPNRAVPPAPATSAVPARSPMWCSTCGASPTTAPIAPTRALHHARSRRPAPLAVSPEAAGAARARVVRVALGSLIRSLFTGVARSGAAGRAEVHGGLVDAAVRGRGRRGDGHAADRVHLGL